MEMYTKSRFIAMTGNHMNGTPETIEHRQEEIDALYKLTFTDEDEKTNKVSSKQISFNDFEKGKACKIPNVNQPTLKILIEKSNACLTGVKNGRTVYRGNCIGRDDNNPSMDISVSVEGFINLNDWAGKLTQDEIIEAAGLKKTDLFPINYTPKISKNIKSEELIKADMTTRIFSDYLNLPEDYLIKRWGLREKVKQKSKQCKGWFGRYVSIPVYDENREYLYDRKRWDLDGGTTETPYGKPSMPIGLKYLREYQEYDFIIIGEGESDAMTLDFHGFPCVNVPCISIANLITENHLSTF